MGWKEMMMILKIGNRYTNTWLSSNNLRRNFTLIEVMISVVILSIGLVFILQGISSSINATGLSQQITEACILAENKISELEMKLLKGIEIPSEERGEDERFNWNYIIKDRRDIGLSEFYFKVSDKRGREVLEVITYLRGL